MEYQTKSYKVFDQVNYGGEPYQRRILWFAYPLIRVDDYGAARVHFPYLYAQTESRIKNLVTCVERAKKSRTLGEWNRYFEKQPWF